MKRFAIFLLLLPTLLGFAFAFVLYPAMGGVTIETVTLVLTVTAHTFVTCLVMYGANGLAHKLLYRALLCAVSGFVTALVLGLILGRPGLMLVPSSIFAVLGVVGAFLSSEKQKEEVTWKR
jgi:hypothetical protein